MTWHESLLCWPWSCDHFAHPISQVQKYYFTTFFCTILPLWRPPQPEIRKIQKSHECVFCSHSLYLQNELFPNIVASKNFSTLIRCQSLWVRYLRDEWSHYERNTSKWREWVMASIWTLKTPPAVVYGGPGGPSSPRENRKKSSLKIKLQTHIYPWRSRVGKSKSITKLFTKILPTTWRGFFSPQAKKFSNIFSASHTLSSP
jgi:hypothetical protein